MHFLPHSPHAIPDRLRLRVNRISLQEYDRLQYDKERLRDICKNAVTRRDGGRFSDLCVVLGHLPFRC